MHLLSKHKETVRLTVYYFKMLYIQLKHLGDSYITKERFSWQTVAMASSAMH